MLIDTVFFVDVDQTAVSIVTRDPGTTIQAPWPISSWHREHVDQWIAEGHSIQVYVEPPDDSVPATITFRQAVIGFRHAGLITDIEAEAWAARQALPELILNVIAQLPAEQQSDARITALTMTEIERHNPLIELAAIMLLPNATPEDRVVAADNYFRSWAQI